MIARLSSVRGVGTWTAQMFLIFQLMRLDVWPTEDLGVRKGYGAGLGHPDANGETTATARRALPQRCRLVLLASRRALRRRGG